MRRVLSSLITSVMTAFVLATPVVAEQHCIDTTIDAIYSEAIASAEAAYTETVTAAEAAYSATVTEAEAAYTAGTDENNKLLDQIAEKRAVFKLVDPEGYLFLLVAEDEGRAIDPSEMSAEYQRYHEERTLLHEQWSASRRVLYDELSTAKSDAYTALQTAKQAAYVTMTEAKAAAMTALSERQTLP